ncbi:MAG: hypothetical protein ACW99G_23010 [Candidatus Thorarchaeota archaeon]|jgi:chromosome segregation ATPase
MTILKELDNIDREIETATREMNQAEGSIAAKTKTLKDECGITPKQVGKTLKGLDEEISEIAEAIETKFKQLTEDYSW